MKTQQLMYNHDGHEQAKTAAIATDRLLQSAWYCSCRKIRTIQENQSAVLEKAQQRLKAKIKSYSTIIPRCFTNNRCFVGECEKHSFALCDEACADEVGCVMETEISTGLVLPQVTLEQLPPSPNNRTIPQVEKFISSLSSHIPWQMAVMLGFLPGSRFWSWEVSPLTLQEGHRRAFCRWCSVHREWPGWTLPAAIQHLHTTVPA